MSKTFPLRLIISVVIFSFSIANAQLTRTGFYVPSSNAVIYQLYSINGIIFIKPDGTSYNDNLFRSIDGGLTWSNSDDNLNIMKIIRSRDKSHLFCLSGNNAHVYFSTNMGINWIDITDTSRVRYSVNSICSDKSGNLILSSTYGVFKTTDEGKSWINLTPQASTSVKESNSVRPEQYSLSQNYPNPFNPATRINYSVQRTGNVTINVYDLLGREIATLVNEIKPAGNYSVEFNSTRLSSGIYFYRMESGSFTHTKKLVVIK